MYYENFKSILDDLDNDFELMHEIISDLMLLVQETKLNIEIGHSTNNYILICQSIHKLKGALLNFRLYKEIALLESMELECKNNKLSYLENNIDQIYNNIFDFSNEYKIFESKENTY